MRQGPTTHGWFVCLSALVAWAAVSLEGCGSGGGGGGPKPAPAPSPSPSPPPPAPIASLKKAVPAASIVQALAFSPDGKWLAVGSDEKARLYEMLPNGIGDNASVTLAAADDYIYAVAFSKDGAWLATGSTDSHMRLYAVKNENVTLVSDFAGRPGYDDFIRALAFSPDLKWLAASGHADMGGELRLYSLEGQGAQQAFTRSDLASSVLAFTSTSSHLAVGSGADVSLYTVSGTGGAVDVNLTATISAPPSGDCGVTNIVFSGDQLLTTTACGDARLYRVDGAAASLRQTFDEARRSEKGLPELNGAALAGGLAATVGQDGVARLYHAASTGGAGLTQSLAESERPLKAVTISPDGRWIATGGWDMTIRLYAVKTMHGVVEVDI